MYQPGQAPPGMVCAGELASLAGRTKASVPPWFVFPPVMPRRVETVSVAGVSGCALFGDLAGLQIGFAAHDGGDAGGVVAAGVGVVGQAGGH